MDFQTGHFADCEQFEIDSHIPDFEQVQIDPLVYFYYFEQVTIILLSLDKRLGRKNQSKPSLFDKRFKLIKVDPASK